MSRQLTKKQRGFIKDYVSTGNGSLAAHKNYAVSSDESARVVASVNLTKVNIQKELHRLGFDSNNAKRVVAEILNDETVEPRDRLRATELVFKVNKDFTDSDDTKVLIVNVSSETASKYAIERHTDKP